MIYYALAGLGGFALGYVVCLGRLREQLLEERQRRRDLTTGYAQLLKAHAQLRAEIKEILTK